MKDRFGVSVVAFPVSVLVFFGVDEVEVEKNGWIGKEPDVAFVSEFLVA